MAPSAEAALEWSEGNGAVGVSIIRSLYHPCNSDQANKYLNRCLTKLGGSQFLPRAEILRRNGWQFMAIVETREQLDAIVKCCSAGEIRPKCVQLHVYCYF